MANSCPLNFQPVDSHVSRVTSSFVVFLVLLYLYTNNVFVLLFLAIDFIIKLFFIGKTSPLTYLAKGVKKMVGFRDKLVDGGAKRLAGFFGLFFVMTLIVIHPLNLWVVAFVVAVVFMFCSLLDVVFNYCIGCKIYFVIKKIYPNFMENV